MTTTADERDRATALTLGWLALVFTSAWVVVGMLDGGVRLVDAWRWHDAAARFSGWKPLLPVGAELLLGMLRLAGMAALCLGVALGVASLVVRGRVLRGVLLAVVALVAVALQVLSVRLDAGTRWTFGDPGEVGARLSAAAVAFVVPVMLLPAVWFIPAPALGRRRSAGRPRRESLRHGVPDGPTRSSRG